MEGSAFLARSRVSVIWVGWADTAIGDVETFTKGNAPSSEVIIQPIISHVAVIVGLWRRSVRLYALKLTSSTSIAQLVAMFAGLTR